MHSQLAAIAARNGGPFTRAQALRAGESATTIRSHLRSGRWTILRRGVYVETALLRCAAKNSAHRHALDIAAAALALDTRDLAGSHHSAACVHGLDLLNQPDAETVMVTRPTGYDRRSPRLAVHAAELPPDQRCVRYGVPVTSPARTVVDLARVLPFRDAVVVADSALRDTAARAAGLHTVLSRCAGWPGITAAAEVVFFADPLAESAFESVSRVFLAEQGFPPPQTQVCLSDDRGPIGRVDFY